VGRLRMRPRARRPPAVLTCSHLDSRAQSSFVRLPLIVLDSLDHLYNLVGLYLLDSIGTRCPAAAPLPLLLVMFVLVVHVLLLVMLVLHVLVMLVLHVLVMLVLLVHVAIFMGIFFLVCL
jgi:hypothetical protein